MTSHFILGINPSIAKLIYLLNFWGVKTYESHASFYPGDTEEQEYWAQKKGIYKNHKIDITGPVVILGNVFRLPSVYFLVNHDDIESFLEIINSNWSVSSPSGHMNEDTEEMKSCKLEYRDPNLLKFKQIWDELWLEIEDQFDFNEKTIGRIYKNDIWKKVNEYLILKFPLSESEFNEIRNQGIKQLEESLLQSITNFDNHRFKHLADKFVVDLNLREDYDLSYFRDFTE